MHVCFSLKPPGSFYELNNVQRPKSLKTFELFVRIRHTSVYPISRVLMQRQVHDIVSCSLRESRRIINCIILIND